MSFNHEFSVSDKQIVIFHNFDDAFKHLQRRDQENCVFG